MSGTFLAPGEYLRVGEYLISPDKKFFAIMQADGNFCVYRGSDPLNQKNCIWATNTYGNGPSFVVMQDDGNICVYKETGPQRQRDCTWASGTNGKGKSFLAMQDDGNLCLYLGTGPNDNKGFLWGAFQTRVSYDDSETVDLDGIFRKYGDWWCGIWGEKCDAIKYEIKGFEQHRLIVSGVEVEYYDDPVIDPVKPTILDQISMINESSVEQSQTLSISKTTLDKTTWNIKGGVKVGMKLIFAAGFPFASAKSEFTGELNVEAGGGGEKSVQRQWTITQPVKVPPKTRCDARVSVDEQSYKQKFRCTFYLSGEIASTSPNRVNGHYYWFHSMANIFSRYQHKNVTILGNKVRIQTYGEMAGNEGLKSVVSIIEKSLGDSGKMVRAYRLDEAIEGAGIAPVPGELESVLA